MEAHLKAACIAVLTLATLLRSGVGYGAERSPALRDAEGYAVATCLSSQGDAYLKAQGDGWGSVVIQRGEGDMSVYRAISDAVRRQLRKGDIPVIRLDATPPRDEPLPVVYCGEIIDHPLVRQAIDRAAMTLAPAYRRHAAVATP